jgi:glycerol-3-phosphate dehydrogenase (NAD(P)+)
VKRIAVLGAGAWGTALAAVLSARHAVTLWARDASQAEAIARERRNRRYLPEVELPAPVTVTSRWPESAELLLAATPVAGLREVSARAGRTPLIWLCKGFESGSGMLPHQIVADERAPLLHLGDPPQPGFERGRGVVDVIAIERVPHLETEGVPRAEPDRLGLSRPGECLSELRRVDAYRYGLITMCCAGGLGVAMIIEKWGGEV